MLGFLKKKSASATPVKTTPAIDIISGPRSNATNCSLCFVRKETDWNPQYGSLTIRQNYGENRYDPTPDRDGDCIKHVNIFMAEDDIVKYVSEYLNLMSHKMQLVIMTADACGMYPTHIYLKMNDNTATIRTSIFCTKHNIDNNVIRLIQKILDSRKIDIDFEKELNGWDDHGYFEISA